MQYHNIMKKISYQNASNLYFIGSWQNGITGLLKYINTRLTDNVSPTLSGEETIRKMNKLTNSIIIVLGNCHLGQHGGTRDELVKFNETLIKGGTHLLFVRGENDNRDIFKNDEIRLSNIKLLDDYSLINFKKYNILTVGGNISIDRSWKKQQESIIGKRLYWDNERTVYEKDLLEEILKSTHIDFIASVSCPTFVSYPILSYYKDWVNADNNLQQDIIQERMVMDRIYHDCILSNNMPLGWVFSHTSSSCDEIFCNNIMFKGLVNKQLFSCSDWLESYDEYDSQHYDLNANFDEYDSDELIFDNEE